MTVKLIFYDCKKLPITEPHIMYSTKYICLLYLVIYIRKCVAQDIFYGDRPISYRRIRVEYHSDGIFERFLKNLLDLLTKDVFPERKLTRYCRILGRHLSNMGFKHTRKLAKHMKYLSKLYRTDLRDEMIQYRNELNKDMPSRREFLDAMNSLFTLRENMLFDDYVYELRNYGTEDKLYIDEETRQILDTILGSVYKLSTRDQIDLEKKLRRAIREYNKVAVYNFYV